ncbi:hypothetical protein [Schleiferilactobacillus shenzhenensis]|uniref:hypothetical protein n=1 Tax=Schleiferilactobacillus shenzhenensis TaxID=1231337 RepID=UPI001FE0E1A1|nr:hypothetical protein [Schleiferilactobacillus shenzhenensis]
MAQLKLLQPIQGDGQQDSQSQKTAAAPETTVPQNGTLGLSADEPTAPASAPQGAPSLSSQPTWDQPAAGAVGVQSADDTPSYPGFSPVGQTYPTSASDQSWQQQPQPADGYEQPAWPAQNDQNQNWQAQAPASDTQPGWQPQGSGAPRQTPWQPQASAAPEDMSTPEYTEDNSQPADVPYYGTPSGNAYGPINGQNQGPAYGQPQNQLGQQPSDTQPQAPYGAPYQYQSQQAPQQPQPQPAEPYGRDGQNGAAQPANAYAYQAPTQNDTKGPTDQYGQYAQTQQSAAPQYDTSNTAAAPDDAAAASSYDPMNTDYGAPTDDQSAQDTDDQYADNDHTQTKETFHIGVTDILGAIFSLFVMIGVYIPGYFSNTASLVDFSKGTSLLSKMQLTSPATLRYLLLVIAALGPLIFIVFSFWKRRSSPLIRFGAGVFSVIGYAFLFVLMFAKGAITTIQIQSTGFALMGYISLACLLGEFIIGLVDLMRS